MLILLIVIQRGSEMAYVYGGCDYEGLIEVLHKKLQLARRVSCCMQTGWWLTG
jgi:hypothetical protein